LKLVQDWFRRVLLEEIDKLSDGVLALNPTGHRQQRQIHTHQPANATLSVVTLHRVGIGNSGVSDERVERQPGISQALVQYHVHLLACHQQRRTNLVPQFIKVLHGQIRQRICISFAQRLKLRERSLKILSILVQSPIHHLAILESSVHSLTVKRRDCVTGIAE
jgi:hypothetical protein